MHMSSTFGIGTILYKMPNHVLICESGTLYKLLLNSMIPWVHNTILWELKHLHQVLCLLTLFHFFFCSGTTACLQFFPSACSVLLLTTSPECTFAHRRASHLTGALGVSPGVVDSNQFILLSLHYILSLHHSRVKKSFLRGIDPVDNVLLWYKKKCRLM